MKIVLKYLAIVLLGAAGASAVIYADTQCPKKKAELQKQIDLEIVNYLEKNPSKVLEAVAKSENFSTTIHNFSNISDAELEQKVATIIGNNPEWFENTVRQNAETIANVLTETGVIKNVVNAEENIESGENAEDDTNKIYKEHWSEMLDNEVAPSVGPKNAKVTVVEFFDFACGHCKSLAPLMAQLMKTNQDVRFIFNPLFFISEHSSYAAKVSLAASEKGKFQEVYEGIMTLPDMNEDTINQILTDEGLNVDEIKKMIDEKKIRRGIQDIDALSQVLGINGVPMLLINGEAFYGRSLEDIQNKINSLK